MPKETTDFARKCFGACCFVVLSIAVTVFNSAYGEAMLPETQPNAKFNYSDSGKLNEPLPLHNLLFHDPQEIDLFPHDFTHMVPLGKSGNPIKIEASYDETFSLKQVLETLILYNLQIRISQENTTADKWRYRAILGQNLPDLCNSYQDQYLKGAVSINGPLIETLNNPFVTTQTGLRWYAFRGGEVFFGALQARHQWQAATAEHHATISDALLAATDGYYDLLLNEALLQIKVQAVKTSEALLVQDRALKSGGMLTNLEVLQAKAQLARDRESLIEQEMARRAAAIRLSTELNIDSAGNLLLSESKVVKTRLLSAQLTPDDLLNLAVSNRPELKQYAELRLAAKRAIPLASSPLMPHLYFFGNISGSGATLSRSYVTMPPSFSAVGIAGPAGTANVLANVANGLPPVIAGFPQASLGAQTVYPAAVVLNPAQKVSQQIRSLFCIGFNLEWNFEGMGVPSSCRIQAARAEARKASAKYDNEFQNIVEEVRDAYIKSLSTEQVIEETTEEVEATFEELDFAEQRVNNGLGVNLDVITAQRDLTAALVKKAQSIIDFNKAQMRLLHAIGLMNIDRICSARLIDRTYLRK